MTLHLIGTGDAFGSGGRLNTCFHVRGPTTTLLIDCGATSLSGLRRMGLDPGDVDVIVVTHFHGDHMGGIPFLIRETQILGARSRPLRVVGPVGLERHLASVAEGLFPGSSKKPSPFLTIAELKPWTSLEVDGTRITLAPVVHTPGTNPHGVRVELDGRTLVYSGDTEWTPNLPRLAEGADLFVCECYKLSRTVNHMDYETLLAHQGELPSDRILLTHASVEVLDRSADLAFRLADDGETVALR